MVVIIWIFVISMCILWLVCLPIYLILNVLAGTAGICNKINIKNQMRKLNKK